jgi:hypothetical protein
VIGGYVVRPIHPTRQPVVYKTQWPPIWADQRGTTKARCLNLVRRVARSPRARGCHYGYHRVYCRVVNLREHFCLTAGGLHGPQTQGAGCPPTERILSKVGGDPIRISRAGPRSVTSEYGSPRRPPGTGASESTAQGADAPWATAYGFAAHSSCVSLWQLASSVPPKSGVGIGIFRPSEISACFLVAEPELFDFVK